MTSLPMPASWTSGPPESAPPVPLARELAADADYSNADYSNAGSCDAGSCDLRGEQFLLHAFHSFSDAALSLERSYGELRAEVERLRRELEETQSRLRREQALAEISAELAHEIRNPLGSLELFAGLLAEARLSGAARDWVEQVQAGLRILTATVNNVLHFHSASASERSPVDLGELVLWARQFFLPLARQSAVTVSLNHDLEGVLVSADRHRFEQVLANLILNALRAMPGGGSLELSGGVARDRKTGQRAALLAVADTGEGIAPEHRERLFEPGFSTRAGSPGLGLAVCRRIVEEHGGTISASNRATGGARFTVTLPLAAGVMADGATDQKAFSAGAGQ